MLVTGCSVEACRRCAAFRCSTRIVVTGAALAGACGKEAVTDPAPQPTSEASNPAPGDDAGSSDSATRARRELPRRVGAAGFPMLLHPLIDRLELPSDDSIDALGAEAREAIASHWLTRARSELRVALGFEALGPRLRAVGAIDAVNDLVAKAIVDERRHGALCVQLAERYAGRDLEVPQLGPSPQPSFGTDDEPLEVALLVLGTCCINESIASAWIRACQRAATSPVAVFANRVHLRDEIDHARLGWAHLASDAITPALRAKLRPWTSAMVRVNVTEWKAPDRFLPEDGIRAHGHLSHRDNERVIDDAVQEIVLPGLRHVGLG